MHSTRGKGSSPVHPANLIACVLRETRAFSLIFLTEFGNAIFARKTAKNGFVPRKEYDAWVAKNSMTVVAAKP